MTEAAVVPVRSEKTQAPVPSSSSFEEAVERVYSHYGPDLTVFFRDIASEFVVKKQAAGSPGSERQVDCPRR